MREVEKLTMLCTFGNSQYFEPLFLMLILTFPKARGSVMCDPH